MPMYQRPAFWRVPHQRPDPDDEQRSFGRRRVTPGTPAGKELARGDIIAKIDDYDARDLRHEDAQNLFKNANNQIKLVVQRTPSPLPSAWRGPESLPRSTPVPPYTQFPVQQEGEFRSVMMTPPSSRGDDVIDESIQSQPYRTTPLVLPGAKVRREPGPTESYLRHHPNPAMRAPPHHDYRDTLMKQKVAESVLQRVVGEEGNKFVHKQFNSPINLYSEQNIANSIRQQTTPLPSNGHYGRPNVVKSHKPTVQYDPAASDTYRALHDSEPAQQHSAPPAAKVFTAPHNKRPTPAPKAKQSEANSKTKQTTFVNSLHEEHIQQSNSFKRLMYNVLGDTEL
ncbi:PREDICTED: PDZ and LIM domain protein 3 isoform X5 [Papilio xuthus]|uniref:PDZ and LIM domain protein 3 isoform X5 n=1 Tax=Papilio xuthus TaxID=66420 RepID=A0AAJ6ZRR8_PAPXU|nr:PREDICTED: PDZ and LIM domain protein 3 isoform X5 [Papilio xuthus]